MALTAAEIFRDYETDGVPSSGVHDPKKSNIRQLLGQYEQIINAFLSNGGLVYSSKAAMDADLAHAANSMAWVVSDATAANNGIYRKSGASGSGSWTRVADLPYSFIVASDVGDGTPDAIVATSSLPVSSSALVLLNVYETNTGSPVTVSFNGGTPLTIKTNSGNDVAPGGLVSGMLVMGRVSGSTFRVVSDHVSSAILAQAEALVIQASAAADRAEAAASTVVTARTFGALGDGVTDDTDAIEAWLASGPSLTITDGVYLTGKITVPTTVKSIRVLGKVTLKPVAGTFTTTAFKNEWYKGVSYVAGDSIQFMPTFENIADGLTPTGLMYRALRNNSNVVPGASALDWEVIPFDDFWLFAGHTDLSIEGLGVEVPCLAHPHVRAFDFSGCHGLRTRGLRVIEGGAIGIYNGNCTDVVHSDAQVKKYAWLGMFGEGTLQRDVTFNACHVSTFDTGTAHGIGFSLGKRCQAIGCTSKNAHVFGFTVNETDGFVLDGISIDSGHEGFNTISGKNGIIRGVAKWEDVLSTDFGVSIDGTTGSGVYNVKADVVVEQSGVSALVFTGTVTDCEARVIAKNCNQTSTALEAGILFSGSNCQRNTGYITLVDQYPGGRIAYGIAEIDKGNGSPSNNTLHVQSVSGAIVADALRAGPTTKIFGASERTFVPVVSAESGAIGSAAGTIKWKYDGLDVVATIDVTITTIGTGAGAIRLTLPVPAVAEGGMFFGKEILITGKGVTGEISATHVLLRAADGTPINTSGTRIVATGRYKPSS